jgi:hypothetical protein
VPVSNASNISSTCSSKASTASIGSRLLRAGRPDHRAEGCGDLRRSEPARSLPARPEAIIHLAMTHLMAAVSGRGVDCLASHPVGIPKRLNACCKQYVDGHGELVFAA